MGYGTGAIMAVPAHDQRDFEFARKFDIPIVLVYKTDEAQTADSMTEALPTGGVMTEFTPSPGAMAPAAPFAGSPNNKETVGKVHSLDGCADARVRQRGRQLPPARLADFAPAVLGSAYPDHSLPDARRSSRS